MSTNQENAITKVESMSEPNDTTTEVAIGGSKFSIIYKPALSEIFVSAIVKLATAFMTTSDGKGRLYQISEIMDVFNYPEVGDPVMTEQDVAIIKACNDKYDYLEI